MATTTTTRFANLEVTTIVDGDILTQRFAPVASPNPLPIPTPTPTPTPTPGTWTYPKPTTGIFVVPNGSGSANGTITNPMSLEKALSLPGAGQQVWIRSGTYSPTNTLAPRLNGTREQPWKISAYPGEDVTINCATAQRHGIHFDSDNSWQEWRGVRFTDPSAGGPGGAVYCLLKADAGNDVTFAHCQFDNGKRSGIQTNGPAAGFVFYGCIVLNNGTDTQFDHGAYCNSLAGTLTFENCFILNNAGHQCHFYNGSTSSTYGIRGMKAIDNGIFTYGEPSDRFIIMQDSGPKHEARDCTITGNVCFNQFPGVDATDRDRSTIKLMNGAGNTRVAGNSIWGGDLTTSGSVTRMDNIIVSSGNWAKQEVWVRPSKFDEGLVHVTIFNPLAQPSVNVDLTKVFPAGNYEIRAASSPQKVAASGTYAGTGPVSFPMTGLDYAAQTRSGGFAWKGTGKAAGFVVKRVP